MALREPPFGKRLDPLSECVDPSRLGFLLESHLQQDGFDPRQTLRDWLRYGGHDWRDDRDYESGTTRSRVEVRRPRWEFFGDVQRLSSAFRQDNRRRRNPMSTFAHFGDGSAAA